MNKLNLQSFKVFRSWIVSSLLFTLFFSISFVQTGSAQTDSLISNPTPSTDYGYYGNPIVYGSNLYIQYQTSIGKYQLAKYNGTTIVKIANPGADAGNGFLGNQIVFKNNLYFTYQKSDGKNYLAKFDGTTITLLTNPDVGPIGSGVIYDGVNTPITDGNNLYFRYLNASGKYQLAKYSGTGSTFTLVNNLAIADVGFWTNAGLITYNNMIYYGYRLGAVTRLAQYNPLTNVTTLITSPAGGGDGFQGSTIVFNGNLYFEYKKSTGITFLVKYNGGASFTTLSNPDAGLGLAACTPIVFNGNIYYKYLNAASKNQLVKYNGSGAAPTQIGNADAGNGYFGNPIVFKNNLYFNYQDATPNPRLGKYDGIAASITLVNNPAGHTIGFGPSIIHNNNLYLGCVTGTTGKLARYDGTTIFVVANPVPGTGYTDNLIIYKSHVYFKYQITGPKGKLCKVIHEPCNKYIQELGNGDMQFTVTLTGKQSYVEVFVTKDKISNIIALAITGSEVNNGDGTYTYTYVNPAANYQTNDSVFTRFYSYKGVDPQVFTPGPGEFVWSDPFIYNVSVCDTVIVINPPLNYCDNPQGNMDLKILSNGNVTYSITLGSHQQYIELFYQINGGAAQGMGNIVSSEVINGSNYTYSFTVPAATFVNGNSLTYRFYGYVPGPGPGIFYPGPTEGIYSTPVTYGPCITLRPIVKAVSQNALEIKQIDNQVICLNVNESNLLVQVYNMSGQLVYTTNTKAISLDQFASGIYLITAISNGERTSTKVYVK